MKLSKVVSYGAAAVAFLILLVPGLLVASTWTPINLAVALCAVAGSIFIAIWIPKWKWPMAAVSSVLIAVPPYPYWLFGDNAGSWYFHFFHGFSIQNLSIPTFVLVFAISLMLFAVIFWALRNKGRVELDR